jgi:hypothetical protein
MKTEDLQRLQEGALSARKTPAPPAPAKLVPISSAQQPAPQPAAKENA